MQTFRAYLLDEQGKIRSGDWIEAVNENEALAAAQALWRGDGSHVEVWLGAHKVGDNLTSTDV